MLRGAVRKLRQERRMGGAGLEQGRGRAGAGSGRGTRRRGGLAQSIREPWASCGIGGGKGVWSQRKRRRARGRGRLWAMWEQWWHPWRPVFPQRSRGRRGCPAERPDEMSTENRAADGYPQWPWRSFV